MAAPTPSPFELAGRVAIVTGANTGLTRLLACEWEGLPVDGGWMAR